MEQVVKFLKEVRGEFGKVVWPSREEAIKLTLIVIGTAALCGIFISGLDYLFSNLVERLIK